MEKFTGFPHGNAGAMCDVKELFSPQRQRLLHGVPQEPPAEPPWSQPAATATWRAFPDPAVKQRLQEKAMETMERLQNCLSHLVSTSLVGCERLFEVNEC